jgi:hypothetical protein
MSEKCDKCGAPLISASEVESVAYLLMRQHDKSVFGTVPLTLEHFIPEAKALIYEKNFLAKKVKE